MRRFPLVQLFATVLVIVTALAIGGVVLLWESLPPQRASVQLAGLSDTVRIWRDSLGIPTVAARRSWDAFAALGYLHAQDRLWQMDLLRRVAYGRLAEILGAEALPLDQLMRALNFAGLAQQLWERLHPVSRRILAAYSSGVNAWLSAHRNRLPLEFDLLAYAPDTWQPQHSLAIARLMAFDLAFAFWSDIACGSLASELGLERARELLPSPSPTAPAVLEEFPTAPPPPPASAPAQPGLEGLSLQGFSEWATALTALGQRWRFGSAHGSNAWAVRSGGTAVLANDPHLVLGLPARRYPVALISPEYTAAGLTLPGLPLIIIGRNREIAWGVTNVMLDDCDFFIERLDTADALRYWDGTQWRSFERRRERIPVRHQAPVQVEFLHSHNGVIISDAHLFNAPQLLFRRRGDTTRNPFLRRYRVSLRWTAMAPSDEVLVAYRLGQARSWEEFRRALRGWGAPALCFVYADRRGNIGVQPAGFLPRRDTTLPEWVWAFPLPGWDTRYRWQGLDSLTSLPPLFNPAQGFVVSANQQLFRHSRRYLSYIWEPPERAQRIVELLLQRGRASPLQMRWMQQDVVSPYARELLRELLPRLRRLSRSPQESTAVALLERWGYDFAPHVPAASIFAALLQELLEQTFGQHLSARLLREYLFLSNLSLRRLMELIRTPDSPWFDNPRTPARETLEEVLQHSFRRALERLYQHFGTEDMAQWSYGKLHTLLLQHPLGEHPLLRALFSRGPFPSAGAPTTVNAGEWKLWEPFAQTIGASARVVAQLSDSLLAVALPGGVSGHPLSPHYMDQFTLWRVGGFAQLSLGHPAGTPAVLLTPAPRQGASP